VHSIPIGIHGAMVYKVSIDVRIIFKLAYQITLLIDDEVTEVLGSWTTDVGTVICKGSGIDSCGMCRLKCKSPPEYGNN